MALLPGGPFAFADVATSGRRTPCTPLGRKPCHYSGSLGPEHLNVAG